MASGDCCGDSLAEALQKSSEPIAWTAYKAIERKCLKAEVIRQPLGYRVLDITGGSRRWKQLSMEIERAREPLVERLVERLRTGEWAATGIQHPMSPTSKRLSIAPHLWGVLRPEFVTCTASGGGLMYLDVRVNQAGPKAADTTSKGRRPGKPKIRDFVSKFVGDEKAAGRPISQLRLEHAAKQAELNATRDQLRQTREEISPTTMGRPKKLRK